MTTHEHIHTVHKKTLHSLPVIKRPVKSQWNRHTGGPWLSCTAVKLDSSLTQIFCQKFFVYFVYFIVLISQITHKSDRFSCSQKIWLKQNPPVIGYSNIDTMQKLQLDPSVKKSKSQNQSNPPSNARSTRRLPEPIVRTKWQHVVCKLSMLHQ